VPTNPSTIAAGIAGQAITKDFLLAQNPGATIQQIDNGLVPRLGRPMRDTGTRDRYNGIVSLEFRPTDDLHFSLDSMYGRKKNDLERVDLMWGVRRTSQGGLIIPQNLQFDRSDCSQGCVVTSGVFPNSEFLLEYRPYEEDTKFWGTNPGMQWQLADKFNLDVQGNYTKSKFERSDPTVLLLTQPSTVTYTNDGGIPSIQSNIDLNSPASYGWLVTNRGGNSEVGRTDLVDEKRETDTKGGRLALTWGDAALNLKVGGAYDVVSRDIRPLANSQLWQNQACGGNPSVNVLAPNTEPACRGETAAQIAPGVNGYPTYASYSGSLIPNGAVPNYLRPTDAGFVFVDWDQFRKDSGYDAAHAALADAGATPTTASWGSIEEDVTGLFTQVEGDSNIGPNRLRWNAGLRWVKTTQKVASRLTKPDDRNATQADGTKFPDVANIVELDRDYDNLLPSANVAWNVTDDFIVRAGVSKTMTRANPADMLLGLSIPNADVSQVNLGNPDLEPYKSDNIDVGFEYYTGREGYFGVAAFRKGLDGFTTRKTTLVTFADLEQFGVTLASLGASARDAVNGRGGLAAPVQLNQTVNASGRLTINGFEFNWVQPLDFLLDRFHLGGFGLSANYTLIDQKGRGAAPAIAIGVPPMTYNATLYYEKHGVSARLSINSLRGSQGSGPNSNQSQVNGAELFGNSYKQWDFSSSYDFATLFGWSDVIPQLTIDVVNITGETRRTYFQFPNAAFNYFDSGRQVMVGLRGTF
jgi:TonB-dependent receptor